MHVPTSACCWSLTVARPAPTSRLGGIEMIRDRKRLVIESVPTADPEVGRWLGVLADTRVRTVQELEGIDAPMLDQPVPGRNTIGTLAAHIAAMEMDWLFSDMLGVEMPPEVLALLTPDGRDEHGNIWPVAGETLAQHLARLATTREILIAR